MLDIIRIKREGYPVHVDVETFLSKYGILLDQHRNIDTTSEPQVKVKVILNALGLPKTEWQVGYTKVCIVSWYV